MCTARGWLPDNTILALIAGTSTEVWAAVKSCEAIVARVASQTDFTNASLMKAAGQLMAHYTELSERLTKQAASSTSLLTSINKPLPVPDLRRAHVVGREPFAPRHRREAAAVRRRLRRHPRRAVARSAQRMVERSAARPLIDRDEVTRGSVSREHLRANDLARQVAGREPGRPRLACQFANAPTSYAARIEPDSQVIMQPDGTRATSTHKIVTPAVVDERDRIYLTDPAGTGRPRRILRLRELPDEFGAHDHCEIWV
jgi:hypothetical protein